MSYLHARIEAGNQADFVCVVAGFDDALGGDRPVNRPAVAVEVAFDAFDLVALAGSNTAFFLCFFHHCAEPTASVFGSLLHGQAPAGCVDAMHSDHDHRA